MKASFAVGLVVVSLLGAGQGLSADERIGDPKAIEGIPTSTLRVVLVSDIETPVIRGSVLELGVEIQNIGDRDVPICLSTPNPERFLHVGMFDSDDQAVNLRRPAGNRHLDFFLAVEHDVLIIPTNGRPVAKIAFNTESLPDDGLCTSYTVAVTYSCPERVNSRWGRDPRVVVTTDGSNRKEIVVDSRSPWKRLLSGSCRIQ